MADDAVMNGVFLAFTIVSGSSSFRLREGGGGGVRGEDSRSKPRDTLKK